MACTSIADDQHRRAIEIDVESLEQSRTGLLGEAGSGRHGHRVPWRQYLALFTWLCLLSAQYVLTRLVCQLGIPDDCVPDNQPLEVMQDFQFMFSMGFILAVLTGVHQPERFAYLFSFRFSAPRGFFFVALFLLSGPGFGALGFVPVLKELSLTAAFLQGGMLHILEIAVLVIGAVSILLWHFVCAFKHNSLKGFFAYTLSRLAVWSFYGCYLGLAASTSDVSVHLHHYVVGFLCATLAEFNHPVSMALLAIGSGVFVQGISAYEAAPVVQKRGPFLIF